MKLSVIIVNYNVRAYLEQCLRTVFTALQGIDGEVFVVDNLSTDGSVEMVRERFPQVHLIANTENVGFSRANNQAIRISHGEYVVLLNPDTVVGEDVFSKVIAFLDARPKAGGLGVKMIDGTGHFLPESKRGLPTPQVAFFKIIGLTRLFPRSRVFGRYHLGHLPENESAPIEILSGACMFLRRRTLDEVGLLDESFFMYGEDIDLSYRITLGGYENWYFPEARIIHYKGESTKKSSVNYVFVFYNAMAIFAKKHFTRRSAGIFPMLINGSIYLSAAAAIAVRFLNRALLPILDLLAVLLVLALSPLVPQRWPLLPELGLDVAIGLAMVAWLGLFGAYDQPVRMLPPLTGVASLFAGGALGWWAWGGDPSVLIDIGTLTGWATLLVLMWRILLHVLGIKGYGMRRKERERILAVGSGNEARRAVALLWQTHQGLGWTGTMDPSEVGPHGDRLRALIRKQRLGEIVFCARDLAWGHMIDLMERLKGLGAEFKIAQPGHEFIIGPSSIESLQDLFIPEEHALSSPAARRSKRILDVVLSFVLLLAAPLLALIAKRPGIVIRDCWDVIRGRCSWVGYHHPLPKGIRLPALQPGIIDVTSDRLGPVDEVVSTRLNLVYAKDYRALDDLRLFVRGYLRKRPA